MNGEEIAQEFGWSRQYVSNILKQSMRKLYQKLKRRNPELSPFEIVDEIRQYFDLRDTDEIHLFFSLFPPSIRTEIYESLSYNNCKL
jgi:hypothetical protein